MSQVCGAIQGAQVMSAGFKVNGALKAANEESKGKGKGMGKGKGKGKGEGEGILNCSTEES